MEGFFSGEVGAFNGGSSPAEDFSEREEICKDGEGESEKVWWERDFGDGDES